MFDKNSKIYDYLKVREFVKTELYLLRIGNVEPRATHLVVAINELDKIIGYILYHKVVNQPNDIAVINTIVESESRRQGIFKQMMDCLKTEYKSISLSCFPELIEFYKKLDFKIHCQWQTQIAMYYGYADEGQIVTIDDDYLNKEYKVIKHFETFKKTNSNWKEIVNELNSKNSLALEKAERYVTP